MCSISINEDSDRKCGRDLFFVGGVLEVKVAVRGCWRWVRVAARARQLYDVGVGC